MAARHDSDDAPMPAAEPPAAPTLAPPLAVITGATGGIGAALADSLARRGHRLLLVARGEAALTALAARLAARHGVSVAVRAVDLVDRPARDALCAELAGLPVAVLCNNAGVGSFGALHRLPAEQLRRELELDVTAVHELTLAVVGGMVERGRGGLLFSGSIAGNLPIPNNATYAAAKAFVNNFAEALHWELAPAGVAVTLLAPGPVRPPPAPDATGDELDAVPNALWVTAAAAADAALDGLARNRLRVAPGVSGGALSLLSSVGPRRVLSPLVGAAYRRLGADTGTDGADSDPR